MSKELILPRRGMLENVNTAYYKEVTGRDLTVRELRLLPFIQHCFINKKLISPDNLNEEEFKILKEMNKNGLIEFGRSKGNIGWYFVVIGSNFWNVIVNILYDSYVAKVNLEPDFKSETCKMLTGNSFSVNNSSFMKIHYAVINGGSIIESELTKKERDLVDKLEKMDLIYFERRSPESERFNIGTTKILWDVINSEIYNSLKIEEKQEEA